MKRYTVEIADEARDAIRAHVRHVTVELRSPENAQRWLNRVFKAADSLQEMPTRYSRDERQSRWRGEDVYRLTFERTCVMLYVVDEVTDRVRILSFRYGGHC